VGGMKNRLTQSIQHYLYIGFHADVQGKGENGRQNREDEYERAFANESSREMKEGATYKLGDAPPPTAEVSGPLPSGKPDGTVSRAFLNRLMDVFMESVGPIAPLIVRHHIGLLGESKDSFPESRINELIKSLAPEILHPEMRLQFEQKIAEEIRNLDKPV
jgi:hypothetical protein